MIDIILAKQLGDQDGIDMLTIVREYIQILYLHELYVLPKLDKTIFKGGTALRLLLGSNRFSEDLDFNTNLDKEVLDSITNKALAGLKKQVPNVYIKNLETLTGISKKIYIQTELVKHPLTIKLDFSQREDSLTVNQGVIDTKLPISSTVLINYLNPVEILAEKFRALMNRSKGRDVYDAWYLLHKGFRADPKVISKKFAYNKEEYDQEKLIEKIEKWDDKELDQDVRKFLPIKDRSVLGKLKLLLIEKMK